jgi:uncharacterized damage-inducible protein DinB
METVEHLRHLYRFNDWANRIVVRNIRQSGSGKALSFLSHILITEKEYFERLYGKDSTGFDFWPDMKIDECSVLAQQNNEQYEKLLLRFADEGLGQTVRYRTSSGKSVKNSFRELLTHVLFHSMNHRGQILTILREEGCEPPEIDYIVYAGNM